MSYVPPRQFTPFICHMSLPDSPHHSYVIYVLPRQFTPFICHICPSQTIHTIHMSYVLPRQFTPFICHTCPSQTVHRCVCADYYSSQINSWHTITNRSPGRPKYTCKLDDIISQVGEQSVSKPIHTYVVFYMSIYTHVSNKELYNK